MIDKKSEIMLQYYYYAESLDKILKTTDFQLNKFQLMTTVNVSLEFILGTNKYMSLMRSMIRNPKDLN